MKMKPEARAIQKMQMVSIINRILKIFAEYSLDSFRDLYTLSMLRETFHPSKVAIVPDNCHSLYRLTTGWQKRSHATATIQNTHTLRIK